jgi:hypothetical protein
MVIAQVYTLIDTLKTVNHNDAMKPIVYTIARLCKSSLLRGETVTVRVPVVSEQPDNTICGVAAIAYMTHHAVRPTVALDHVQWNWQLLRSHLIAAFDRRKPLLAFPTVTENKVPSTVHLIQVSMTNSVLSATRNAHAFVKIPLGAAELAVPGPNDDAPEHSLDVIRREALLYLTQDVPKKRASTSNLDVRGMPKKK